MVAFVIMWFMTDVGKSDRLRAHAAIISEKVAPRRLAANSALLYVVARVYVRRQG